MNGILPLTLFIVAPQMCAGHLRAQPEFIPADDPRIQFIRRFPSIRTEA